MLDLEGICARWKRAAEYVAVDKHPTVWVAHYGTSLEAMRRRVTEGPQERSSDLLGCVAATTDQVANAVLFLGTPWTVCAEVHETAIVADINHTLHVTHFHDDGTTQYSTDWRVPYGIEDDGSIRFDVGERTPSALWPTCHLLWETRPMEKGSKTFDEAFSEAMAVGNALL